MRARDSGYGSPFAANENSESVTLEGIEQDPWNAVDRLPRPGDYLELAFARYRVVAVHAAEGSAPASVAAVLDRIHRPSRN